jgi:uncharacterized membrane protein YeiB
MLFFPYGYHLPAFLLGIMIKENYPFIEKYSTKLLVALAFCFIISEYFWNGSWQEIYLKFISWGRMKVSMPNIPIGLFHIFIGLIGSMFFFILFYKIYRNNKTSDFLSNLGKHSLAIYVLQVLIIETILTNIVNFENMNVWVYSIPVAIIFAFFEMVICIGIIKLIHLNTTLEQILFGSSYVNKLNISPQSMAVKNGKCKSGA